ncbi:MAG: signal peptidase I [Nitrososphaerales archaeon]|nr:signal peptidase I [Nitrososphaerota archaeon]
MPGSSTLAALLLSVLTIGFASGIASGYFGLNPQVQSLDRQLIQANDEIVSVQDRMTELEEESRIDRLELNLRISDLVAQLTERPAIRYPLLPGTPPIYLNAEVAVTGRIACTGSMIPVIDCGDVTIGYVPEPDHIQVGDIIVFKERGLFCERYTGEEIIHRVTEVKMKDGVISFKTKGDANFVGDPCPVSFIDVVEKIIGIIYDADF